MYNITGAIIDFRANSYVNELGFTIQEEPTHLLLTYGQFKNILLEAGIDYPAECVDVVYGLRVLLCEDLPHPRVLKL